MALASADIGADTVEHYSSLLQDILQQVLPIAQQTCQFSKGGPVSRFRLRTRCTNRKLEGLSKLRKSLHKVAMQHRDTKDADKEVCDDLRNLVKQSGVSFQNNIIATASHCHPDRMTGKAGKNMKNVPTRQQLKERTTLQKNRAEQRCSKTAHTKAIPNKAETDEQAALWRSN